MGLAHVLFHRSTWSPTQYCYLEDLFVDPKQRLKGIGRALIEAVYREADARKCTRTYWATQEFNYRGRARFTTRWQQSRRSFNIAGEPVSDRWV